MDVPIPCPCPESPHVDGDTVVLRDKLDWTSVTTIRKAIAMIDEDDKRMRDAMALATCSEFYMLMGISSWTLVDAKGEALPVSHQAIRDLMERTDVLPISDAADDLYNPVVLLPLAMRASASRQLSPTPASTSPTLTPPSPPRPLKRSSTSTTRTAGIETTSSSLDGVSSSSQSAA